MMIVLTYIYYYIRLAMVSRCRLVYDDRMNGIIWQIDGRIGIEVYMKNILRLPDPNNHTRLISKFIYSN